MHLAEEQIQRLVNSEIEPETDPALQEHLRSCAHCRERMARVQQEEAELSVLLGFLDDPTPAVSPNAIARRASTHGTRRTRWAAGILLALGAAGAAAAIPGSPLRQVIAAWLRPAESAAPPTDAETAPDESGIFVAPGTALIIVFASTQHDGHISVTMTDGTDVEVRALNGTAGFTSDDGRLVVENAGSSASYEVKLPRSAPRVEIRIDERRVLLKEEARVTPSDPTVSAPPYLIPLQTTRASGSK